MAFYLTIRTLRLGVAVAVDETRDQKQSPFLLLQIMIASFTLLHKFDAMTL